jgi:hypothetical protein
VAVSASGGVATTYKGRVLDLMGLNWPAMAHAETRRKGYKNHSAFDAEVFWSARPELMNPHLEPEDPRVLEVAGFRQMIFDGIQRTPRFREEYAPISIPILDRYLVGFARRDWIRENDPFHHGRALGWSNVSFLIDQYSPQAQ